MTVITQRLQNNVYLSISLVLFCHLLQIIPVGKNECPNNTEKRSLWIIHFPVFWGSIYFTIICATNIGITIHVTLHLSELELGPVKREAVNIFKRLKIYHCKHVLLPLLLFVEANRLRLHYILSLCSETCRSPGIKILNWYWGIKFINTRTSGRSSPLVLVPGFDMECD